MTTPKPRDNRWLVEHDSADNASILDFDDGVYYDNGSQTKYDKSDKLDKSDDKARESKDPNELANVNESGALLHTESKKTWQEIRGIIKNAIKEIADSTGEDEDDLGWLIANAEADAQDAENDGGWIR